MQQTNPYMTPTAAVSDMQIEEGFGALKIFTAEGRIGRLRYIFYTMGVGLVGMLLAGLLFMIPAIGPILGVAAYIGVIVASIFLTIQRCHDFNITGWLSLVLLIPIVSLIFYFIPSTKTTNKYGLQPPPNSTAIKIGAIIFLVLFIVSIIGILASIALPAYQDYLVRAAVG